MGSYREFGIADITISENQKGRDMGEVFQNFLDIEK